MSNIFKKNKLISLLLVFVLTFGMLFSTAIPAYATDINSSGNIGKSKVVTTVTPAKFNVTVPYMLPISIDADQNVYTADNVAISNNSNGPIKVSEATMTTNEGWELVADGTDFSSVPVNSKQFSMRVLNSPVLTSGNLNTESFGTINGNSSLTMNYSADAAVQGEEVSATNIANVLFTIEWDSIKFEKTMVGISRTALNSFAKTVSTFQKTSENLNIDDVKEIDGVVKIDSNQNNKVVYAWSDSEGNGYWWTNAMTACLPTDCYNLFLDCTNLIYLDLSDFDATYVTNMRAMVRGCTSLETVKMPSNTQNVTSFYETFYGCKSLKSVDFSLVDTTNVTIMTMMFGQCESLETLDLSMLDTANLTLTAEMFEGCSSLSDLNISTWDTSNLKNATSMFSWCTSLQSLDLSSFDTHKLTVTDKMFYNCKNLKTICVSDFSTSQITSSTNMFDGCVNLVGQNGTKYTSSRLKNKTYARIDTANTPGYFTYKAKPA